MSFSLISQNSKYIVWRANKSATARNKPKTKTHSWNLNHQIKSDFQQINMKIVQKIGVQPMMHCYGMGSLLANFNRENFFAEKRIFSNAYFQMGILFDLFSCLLWNLNLDHLNSDKKVRFFYDLVVFIFDKLHLWQLVLHSHPIRILCYTCPIDVHE